MAPRAALLRSGRQGTLPRPLGRGAARGRDGRALTPLTPAQTDEVRGELTHHGKLAAVKRYRELTGASLPEAMRFVDTLAASAPPPPAPSSDTPRALDAAEARELRAMLLDGAQVRATSYYREKTGATFQQGVAFVEARMREAQQAAPALPTDLLDLAARVVIRGDQDPAAAEMRASKKWPEAQRLAAMARATALSALAGTLCERHRDGALSERDLQRELRAGAPGFGPQAYADAFDAGMRATR